jgi:hypothetical protein
MELKWAPNTDGDAPDGDTHEVKLLQHLIRELAVPAYA